MNKLRIKLDKEIIRKGIDEICVLDPLNRERVFKRYSRKSKIVYCGVNSDFYSKGNKDKALKEWPELKGKFVMMFSGQIVEGKRPLDAIKTIEKLKDKIPNALLVLTGKEDPEHKKMLDLYVKEHKLEKYVKYILFFGERERLRNLYKLADVGLFPMGGQGGWIAPFEMLSAGVPVVISSDMTSSSVLKEHNLGIVTKDYAAAIIEIYNNKEKYKESAEKAFKFIKNNLSWEIFSERMIEAYRRAWRKYIR
jgi:glycosyltransferase involved in cell wall biosynthesis